MTLMVQCLECHGVGSWEAKSHKPWCAEANLEGECDCGAGETTIIVCDRCDGEGFTIQADAEYHAIR